MTSRRAQRRRDERKVCGNKGALSKEQALGVAQFRTSTNPLGFTYDAYHCPLCGAWHTGHRPKKVQRAIDNKRQGKRHG